MVLRCVQCSIQTQFKANGFYTVSSQWYFAKIHSVLYTVSTITKHRKSFKQKSGIRDAKKGLKQVADFQCSAMFAFLIHFGCNRTLYTMQHIYTNSHWLNFKMNQGCRNVLRWTSTSWQHPFLASLIPLFWFKTVPYWFASIFICIMNLFIFLCVCSLYIHILNREQDFNLTVSCWATCESSYWQTCIIQIQKYYQHFIQEISLIVQSNTVN